MKKFNNIKPNDDRATIDLKYQRQVNKEQV